MKKNRFTQDKFFYANRLREKTEKNVKTFDIEFEEILTESIVKYYENLVKTIEKKLMNQYIIHDYYIKNYKLEYYLNKYPILNKARKEYRFDFEEFTILKRQVIQSKWDARKLERSLKKKANNVSKKIQKI